MGKGEKVTEITTLPLDIFLSEKLGVTGLKISYYGLNIFFLKTLY